MILEHIPDTFNFRKHVLEILKTDCYRKGEFTLSSGRKSEHYVNCKPMTLTGKGLTYVCAMMLEYIEDDIVAVGGLTLGADPLVSTLPCISWAHKVPKEPLVGLIVRKKPKGYGVNAWIEGKLPPKGSKVVVVEDVTTTGKSSIIAVEKLRDAGYEVNRIITIVDRQVDGEADTNVLAAKCELISLFSLEELYT
jgi:orotate phosphoribosyltransferase